MVQAKWITDSRWSYCSGKWKLIVNGIDVTDHIPSLKRYSNMGTHGFYNEWHFNDNWDVIWETYEDGLECEDWIKENYDWLSTITKDKKTMIDIYYSISAEDFRPGSCGGCI